MWPGAREGTVKAPWRKQWRISKVTSAALEGKHICAELVIWNISGQSLMLITFKIHWHNRSTL